MIFEILRREGYGVGSRDFYTKIDEWKDWHKGKVGSFHTYMQYNGVKRLSRERASLCMAKKVCEEWANLLMNEKVEGTTQNDGFDAILKDVLTKNNFRVRSNQLIELTFALGTGAFIENRIGGNINIDYITADMIFPLSYDNGEIYDCAFASEIKKRGEDYRYIQYHLRQGNGSYIIKNKFYSAKDGKEVFGIFGNVAEIVQSKVPLFQIITPNIINNYDFSNPMGISVFANAIDVLKGIDLIYDSYQNEFRLGKKRIIVPMGMAQIMNTQDGTMPIFDDNDTEFYAIKETDDFTQLKEINMEIRSEAHLGALKNSLDVLSSLTGLGSDRFSFETYKNGIKTATEVISEKSELFQNLKKHELILSAALKKLYRAVLCLSGKDADERNIKIDFDDSIIQDKEKEFAQDLQLVSSGIMQKWEFRVKHFNESEREAKKMCAEDEFAEE